MAAAVVLTAFVAAYWFAYGLEVFSPRADIRDGPVAVSVDSVAVARALGGDASGTVATSAPAASSVALKGVLAAEGRRAASAVVNTGGRDQVVFVGDEILPGTKLTRITAAGIEINRNGIREEISLDFTKLNPKRTLAATSAPASAGVTPRVIFPLDVAASGNQFSFSRRRLDESLKNPATLTALGRIDAAPGGGARVADAPAGSLAQRLGLQSGDIIRAINGQAVAGPGDLARLYQQFPTLNRIDADVQRGAGVVRLSYTVAQ